LRWIAARCLVESPAHSLGSLQRRRVELFAAWSEELMETRQANKSIESLEQLKLKFEGHLRHAAKEHTDAELGPGE